MATRLLPLLFCLAILAAVIAPPARAQACTTGACVSAGPRLASLSTAQSALLNPLLQTLLPGTAINLTAADWNALAAADIDLNLLLTQLGADLTISDPSQVLDAEIRLDTLVLAAATVLQADGQTAAASVLQALGASLGPLVGEIRLADLLRLGFPPGALANVRLDVLDLLTGWVQLYNFENVVTTPQPIEIDTAALALDGVAAIALWAQVIEPPVYACGPQGTQFYSAAVRLKLNVEVLNTDDSLLAPIIAALDGLSILGVVELTEVSLGAQVLNLQLYADVARAEGSIATVDALASTVGLQARPGLVNLYLGQISDAVFWNRNTILTEAIVQPVDLTSLALATEVRLLPILFGGIPVARVTGDIEVNARAFAQGTPELRTALVTSFPTTVTMTSGTVSLAYLVGELLEELELSASNTGLSLSVIGSPPIPVPVGGILDAILATVTNLLADVLAPLLETLLETVLGGVVDVLLRLLGIGIGQAVFTVEGIVQACVAELVLAKQLAPVDAPGRFDLRVMDGASLLASASAVGHGGATSPVLTEPGRTYSLSELGAAGTDLSGYVASWSCVDGAGTTIASGTGTAFDLEAPPIAAVPQTVTCSFTNRTRQASLTITKSDGSTVYVPGTTATYVITVRNAGPDAATGITVNDTLPSGATLTAPWSCTAANGSCTTASGGAVGGNAVVVQLDLDATGEASISVPVQFSADPADY